ncbi:PREDICTED: cytidine deaminase 7-like [Camelina sativa]|uniref:cytidine deaminase n=1 Tax=Camelina sativa TaxID=90675 RepID=A0ABM0UXM3_CAMSA|nr:PREDICTED: cytidine deaminase 7-like [Camelina sativa]
MAQHPNFSSFLQHPNIKSQNATTAKDQYKFVFKPIEAAFEGVTELKKLHMLIKKAMSLARAPISTNKVGAVGRASSGRFYLGVNVDFPGLPLHYSIHAEQFLVANLALNSEEGLRQLAVAVSTDGIEFGTPCGHCCQFLLEISNAPEIEILIRSKHVEGSFASLKCLLTDMYTPDRNLPNGTPLLLEKRDNCLDLLKKRDNCSTPYSNHLKWVALDAANNSFSPYTDSPSGVALLDNDDIVYRGWYIESVAYNSSLGPVQAALVDFVARGRGKGFDKTVGAVLVEKNDARVSQEGTAKMLLETIADRNCFFKVFHCYVMP